MSGIGGPNIFTGPVPNRVLSRLASEGITAGLSKIYDWYTAPQAAPMSYNRYKSSPGYKNYAVTKKTPIYRAPRASRGFYGPKARMKRCMKEIQERKFIDVASVTTAFDVTGSVIPVNLSATGTDYTERIGRKTTNVSIQMRGLIHPTSTSAVSGLARVLCIYDAQVNGVTPSISDILISGSAISPMNLNNRDRFKIIFDWVRPISSYNDINSGLTHQGGNDVHSIKKFKKINLPTIWDGTTAAIGSCQTGAIYMVFIGTTASGTYSCVWTSRVRFVDN